jgi:hypothetical protein
MKEAVDEEELGLYVASPFSCGSFMSKKTLPSSLQYRAVVLVIQSICPELAPNIMYVDITSNRGLEDLWGMLFNRLWLSKPRYGDVVTMATLARKSSYWLERSKKRGSISPGSSAM